MIERLRRFLARKFVKDTITLQIGKAGVLALSLVGAVIVPRLMQPEAYGRLQLVLSLYALWQVLNLTGIIPSAHTRLAEATGMGDTAALMRFMGFFLRMTLIYSALSTGVLWLVATFTPLADVLYGGSSEIIMLAVLLSVTQPSELLFNLFVITFSSRRQMRAVAALQMLNQFVLTTTTIAAVVISQTPGAVIASRLVYSFVTLIIATFYYQRTRGDYPAVGDVVRAVGARSTRADLQFGFANALDKNLATVFTRLPVQITGVLVGEAAAGYVGLALSTTQQQNFFTASILDNLRAVIPQAVGRGDYTRLWHNFSRVLATLLLAVIVFYGLYALASPVLVPLLFGDEWRPAVPLVQIMAIFGAVSTLGGVFGPLYRVFNYMRGALVIKVVSLAVSVPLGVWLIGQWGAAGGAWMMTLMYLTSVPLTVWLTLPELRRRALHQQQVPA